MAKIAIRPISSSRPAAMAVGEFRYCGPQPEKARTALAQGGDQPHVREQAGDQHDDGERRQGEAEVPGLVLAHHAGKPGAIFAKNCAMVDPKLIRDRDARITDISVRSALMRLRS
jgi:hypothetical protein